MTIVANAKSNDKITFNHGYFLNILNKIPETWLPANTRNGKNKIVTNVFICPSLHKCIQVVHEFFFLT